MKLWYSWKTWATTAGEWLGTKNEFIGRLKSKGFEQFKTSDGVCFRGLRLRDDSGPNAGSTANAGSAGSPPNGGAPNGGGAGGGYGPANDTRPTFAPGGPEDPATTAMRKRASGSSGGTDNGAGTGYTPNFTISEKKE